MHEGEETSTICLFLLHRLSSSPLDRKVKAFLASKATARSSL